LPAKLRILLIVGGEFKRKDCLAYTALLAAGLYAHLYAFNANLVSFLLEQKIAQKV
jgi:hypothetical protein